MIQPGWLDDDGLLWRIPVEQVDQPCGFGRVAGDFDFTAFDEVFRRDLADIELGPRVSRHRNGHVGLAEVLVRRCDELCHSPARSSNRAEFCASFRGRHESYMARLPRSGASFTSLYEYEVTLGDVISMLEFRPLSKRDESDIRTKIASAIGQWLRTEGDYQEPGAKLSFEDIEQSLDGLATRLEEVNSILAAADPGLHHTHSIEVVGQLTSSLSENPEIGSVEQAQKFLADFRHHAWTLAHGARVATWLLSTLPKPPRGRIRQDWHDDFTRAVAHICDLNSVSVALSIGRVTGEPEGRFFEAAAALEKLLPPRMRAPSRLALLRRLDRSRKRITASNDPE